MSTDNPCNECGDDCDVVEIRRKHGYPPKK